MQLKFEIKNQRIYRTDNEKPVAGSVGYLTAQFTFSADWDGLIKTAIFRAGTGTPYEVLIADDGTCEVATQAIVSDTMYVGVRGDSVSGDTVFLPTAANEVLIYAAGATSGTTPEDPTLDVYAQIVGIMEQQSVDAEAAQAAQEGAETARDTAEGYMTAAQLAAETAAETAANETVNAASLLLSGYVTDAQTAKTGAETAQGLAEEAQGAAEAAQGKAEEAQGAAEAAQGLAEEAQEGAETAQGKAENAQTAAAESAIAAAGSATGANGAKTAAQTAKTGAETAQGKAETARDEAKEYAESIYLWQKAPTLETMDFAIMLYPPLLASI